MTHTTEELTPSTRRWRRWVIAGALVALIAGGTGWWLLRPSPSTAGTAPAPLSASTAEVTQGALIEKKKVAGTLNFDGSRTIGTALGGTITTMPAPGAIISVGDTLFTVDNQPVSLLAGTLPAWRAFTAGMTDGPDVAQLTTNLKNLGLFAGPATEKFTPATAQAIRSWQKKHGVAQTGSLALGSVVFAAGDVRVGEAKAVPGDPSSPAMLTVTGTTKSVTVLLDTAQSNLATAGAAVSVLLPNGTQTPGSVATVGAAYEEKDSGGSTKVKIPVSVTLSDAAAADGYDNVGVAVEFARTLKETALQVPVTAVVSDGNGFAVTVKKKGTPTLIPVTLGAFAGGFVEIESGKLAVGDTVVVAE